MKPVTMISALLFAFLQLMVLTAGQDAAPAYPPIEFYAPITDAVLTIGEPLTVWFVPLIEFLPFVESVNFTLGSVEGNIGKEGVLVPALSDLEAYENLGSDGYKLNWTISADDEIFGGLEERADYYLNITVVGGVAGDVNRDRAERQTVTHGTGLFTILNPNPAPIPSTTVATTLVSTTTRPTGPGTLSPTPTVPSRNTEGDAEEPTPSSPSSQGTSITPSISKTMIIAVSVAIPAIAALFAGL